MTIDWAEIKKALYPIRDYSDLSRRWREAFAYTFVRQHYNPALAELAD